MAGGGAQRLVGVRAIVTAAVDRVAAGQPYESNLADTVDSVNAHLVGSIRQQVELLLDAKDVHIDIAEEQTAA